MPHSVRADGVSLGRTAAKAKARLERRSVRVQRHVRPAYVACRRRGVVSRAALQWARNGEPGLTAYRGFLAVRGTLTVIATGSLAGKVSASAASNFASSASGLSAASGLTCSIGVFVVMCGHPPCSAHGATSCCDRALVPIRLAVPGPARQMRVRLDPGLGARNQGARVARVTAPLQP